MEAPAKARTDSRVEAVPRSCAFNKTAAAGLLQLSDINAPRFRIIPFAFAWSEAAELRPLVLAIRQPFRVECVAIPDPLMFKQCSA
jgi:hypothetical protein